MPGAELAWNCARGAKSRRLLLTAPGRRQRRAVMPVGEPAKDAQVIDATQRYLCQIGPETHQNLT